MSPHEAFLRQAEACRQMGSPFTGRVCETLAANLDSTTQFGAKILAWPGDPIEDALPLRAAGALNWLARQGFYSELTAQYPPNSPNEDLARIIKATITRQDAECAAFLDTPPQTNEIGRSAVILTGALEIAHQTGLPLATYEIGASAGLNLIFDHYQYNLGGIPWGSPTAPIHLQPEWQGNDPPTADLKIARRAGCDRHPLHPDNANHRERMLAYIWPDQTARLTRTQAAFDLAASLPYRVEQADAADWIENHFARPEVGVVKTLIHTIVWQYLPSATRQRIHDRLAATGRRATAESPIAWLRLEPDGEAPGAAITLTLWPGGETRTLGRADYHGRWIHFHPHPALQVK